MIVARQRATGVFEFSQSYHLTTYAALIFPFDSAQHIWTDHDFNLHHPQLSFVETSCSSQIPPLALEDERYVFMGSSVGEG